MISFDDYIAHRLGSMHFRAGELRSREVRSGPKMVGPHDHLWGNIIPTLHAADLIRDRLGTPVRVVSGYRTPEYNMLVDGSPTSEHVEFRALDLAADDHARLIEIATDVMDALDARGCATGLGIYDTFVHIDVGATKQHRRRWDSGSKKK